MSIRLNSFVLCSSNNKSQHIPSNLSIKFLYSFWNSSDGFQNITFSLLIKPFESNSYNLHFSRNTIWIFWIFFQNFWSRISYIESTTKHHKTSSRTQHKAYFMEKVPWIITKFLSLKIHQTTFDRNFWQTCVENTNQNIIMILFIKICLDNIKKRLLKINQNISQVFVRHAGMTKKLSFIILSSNSCILQWWVREKGSVNLLIAFYLCVLGKRRSSCSDFQSIKTRQTRNYQTNKTWHGTACRKTLNLSSQERLKIY